MDEHATRDVERLSLQQVVKRHPLFADITPANPPPKTLTLGEAIAAYKSAPERADRSAKTKGAYDFRFALWADLLGSDTPVSSITRNDVKAARDTLLCIPANAVKRWPNQPLAKIAEMAKRQKIAPMHVKSVQLYLDSLVSLLKWLGWDGPHNP